MSTILLVEPAADLAEIIMRELQSAGYDVLYADNGRSAILIHERTDVYLIILDWDLPGVLEALKRLRQTNTTPVLLLVARDALDRVREMQVSTEDYLTKPFTMRELLARVRAFY